MRCFTAGSLLLLLLQYRAHRQIGSRCHGEVPRPRRKAGQGQDHGMRTRAQRNSGWRAAGIFSAPEGIEEKLHITFPATAFCAGRLGGGGAASGVASDAFCPGATATACGGGSGRGCALLDSPFGCASAAGAAPGVVGSSPANLYNRVPSLPFEFGTQTVMPCFPLRAS